uniref:Uncharacterized protein n=1 Tax=Rhizophora mucronata TaxID=61149 RepID=A0A2P2IHX9_RHIMU
MLHLVGFYQANQHLFFPKKCKPHHPYQHAFRPKLQVLLLLKKQA